jgi:peptidoglycan-associated lipoprotein
VILLLCAAAQWGTTGCAKRRLAAAGSSASAAPVTTAPSRPAQPEATIEAPFGESAVDRAPIEAPEGVLRPVYFDFDSSDLRDDARATLSSSAAWLKARSAVEVVIEGHCDERGTIEYNLALGQRRANAVRDYLARLGVSGTRLTTTSYGEERPADAGQGEGAWSRNRRAEFNLE